MLRSVQDFDKFRVVSLDQAMCGRVKDLYFDDDSWQIRYLVISLDPRRFGRRQILVLPEETRGIDFDMGRIDLSMPASALAGMPLAGSVLPVCKQYASIGLGSPGASVHGRALRGVDPHLRSARTVVTYQLNLAGESAGVLHDLIWDEESWQIRYLAVHQLIEGRTLQFHILPQSVERFTWSTERVLLRDLKPVELAGPEPVLERTSEQAVCDAA